MLDLDRCKRIEGALGLSPRRRPKSARLPWLGVALALGAACAPASPVAGPSELARTEPSAAMPTDPPLPAVTKPSLAQRLESPTRSLAALGTGASVTVRRAELETVVTAGTERPEGPPVSGATRFNVASVSKLLTAARITALAHEQRLKLDDSLRSQLPGVRLPDEAGVDRSGDVTLDMLLRHLGGLPHQPPDLDPSRIGSSWVDPGLLRRLSDAWTVPLVAAPGTQRYSNLGYALLGAIIERSAGASYADAMSGYLAAVGMPHASFVPREAEHMAWGIVTRDGARATNPPGWYLSRYSMPFTGLWTSTPELARFGQGLGRAVGDERSPLHAMVTGSARGHGRGPIHGVIDGQPTLEHDGGGPGFLALLVVLPGLDTSLAVACNCNGDDRDVAESARPFLREILAAALGAEG